jgi:hypothetical protein
MLRFNNAECCATALLRTHQAIVVAMVSNAWFTHSLPWQQRLLDIRDANAATPLRAISGL